MTKYNINELLERKKDLESKVLEAVKGIKTNDLEYTKEIIIDHTRDDKESVYLRQYISGDDRKNTCKHLVGDILNKNQLVATFCLAR